MTRALSPAEEGCPTDSPERAEVTEQSHKGGGVDTPPCVRVYRILLVTCLLGKWPYRAVVQSFYCHVLCFLGQPAVSPQTTEFLLSKACHVDFL